ncbi:MAG: hypothetical protein VW870_02470 [Rhodobiaceae bacterium]|jgi:hypothetical protein
MQPDHDKAGDAAGEPSAIVRNLGMIKAAAIIMGVLIIVLTAVVIGTIASRLAKMSAPPETVSLPLPEGATIRAASADDGGFVLIVDGPEGSEIWRLTPDGERQQTIRIVQE